MGKFKKNYDNVERKEAGEGYSGDVPKPGIYNLALVSCKEHTSGAGNEGTEWVFEITDEPYAGWRGWVYSNDEGAAWKELQILEAIGILKPGETEVNSTHEQILKKASNCRGRIKNETYEDEKKGKITTLLPQKDGEGGSKKKDKKKKDDPF